MNDMFFPGLIVGAISGALLGALIALAPYERIRGKCEADLPRSQKCVAQFVPEQREPK